ncbi:protein Flattop [Alca torda]
MAARYGAGQYEDAFSPHRLQNWSVAPPGRQRPSLREGSTLIVANDRGHLLPDVPRSQASPWGMFVGTWEMPSRIPPARLDLTSRSAAAAGRLTAWIRRPTALTRARNGLRTDITGKVGGPSPGVRGRHPLGLQCGPLRRGPSPRVAPWWSPGWTGFPGLGTSRFQGCLVQGGSAWCLVHHLLPFSGWGSPSFTPNPGSSPRGWPGAAVPAGGAHKLPFSSSRIKASKNKGCPDAKGVPGAPPSTPFQLPASPRGPRPWVPCPRVEQPPPQVPPPSPSLPPERSPNLPPAAPGASVGCADHHGAFPKEQEGTQRGHPSRRASAGGAAWPCGSHAPGVPSARPHGGPAGGGRIPTAPGRAPAFLPAGKTRLLPACGDRPPPWGRQVAPNPSLGAPRGQPSPSRPRCQPGGQIPGAQGIAGVRAGWPPRAGL